MNLRSFSMRYRNILPALYQSITQLGWVDGCLHALSTALMRATGGAVRLHKYYFFSQPVNAEPWLPAGRGATIQVREVLRTDPLLRDLPRPAWVIPYRFDQGAICLAAFKEQVCVGFLWMLLGAYKEDEVRCLFIPSPKGATAWDFDVYVAPEHRGGLVLARLWDEANRYLAARGIRWSLSRISAFNAASIASHRRMGARPVGKALFLSIGSFQLSAANVRPRIFVSANVSVVPEFVVKAA